MVRLSWITIAPLRLNLKCNQFRTIFNLMMTTVKVKENVAHPELSIDGDHGEEQHHGQRAPEVGVVPHHLAVEAQRGHGHQHAAHLVEDVLQVDVQLLPGQEEEKTHV